MIYGKGDQKQTEEKLTGGEKEKEERLESDL